jgi:uncharacterized protein (DUF2384 family)
VPVLSPERVIELDDDAVRLPLADVAGYLQDTLGQRVAAHLVGLVDTRQIGRYVRGKKGSSDRTDRRLREAYKIVRMVAEAYDAKTAKAWLFGTNTRLDERAPIDVIRAATTTEEFADVRRAARQFASFDA